ncbi:hypothetical protein [Sphingomonas sp.]|uniref:hypothetical protein n=1 Tax=Sphingomonas sp. TaxID=28214 RepID=UPI002DB7E1E6|nr:hypothetical protein [Sphingomonas sp.]
MSDVRVSNEGVRVYFPRRGGPMFVSHRGSILIPEAAPAEPDTPDAAMSAVLGEEFFASNGPEDGCTLTVVLKDGKVGLDARATMNLPGLPHQSETQFIPAR